MKATVFEAGEERRPSLLPAARPRYLLCEPRYFAVVDELNPWMDRSVQPSPDCVEAEWTGLVRTVESLGADVDVMRGVSGLPDLVFTRDACIPLDGSYVRASFRCPERRAEADHVAAWLRRHGREPADLEPAQDAYLEGGDVCVFGPHVLAGWGFRSSRAGHAALADRLDVTVHSMRLVDPRFYHLDMCVCPLDGRHALVAPEMLDRAARRLLSDLVPEPIELCRAEALSFCANAIVVDGCVVMSQCPPRLRHVLAEHGFEVRCAPVAEFRKAGGAVSCLTLPLNRSTRPAA
ncbi:MAG: hypothetical protein E6J41_13230 [Chloroflexi bacterium]|nr:MAG: hypothetical protein E6J41_13230 [Chloroflexota bacterium]